MKKIIFISFSLVFISIIQSCKEKKPLEIPVKGQTKGFEKLSSAQTKINFANTIEETESFNFLYYQYLYNGGGVAVGDINNDGLQDLYFVGNSTPDKLYMNKGNFVFEDITNQAGLTANGGFKTGVNMIDINKDGFLDIYVCRSVVQEVDKRKNLLYINNGDNTFTERAEAYGLDDTGYSVQAYFLDADKDNTYEVYVLNHPKDMINANNIRVKQNEDGSFSPEELKDYSYISDRYYVMKDGKYQDASESAGILDDAYGLSAVIADFNHDDLPDIYVANDYIKPDRLWINQGNHQFKDELYQYFKHTSFSSMGSDYADLNNDDKPDLMVLDMLAATPERRHQLNHLTNFKKFKDMQRFGLGSQLSRNVLQVNQQPAPFSDIAFMDDMAQTDWSWSVLMADFDNDTFKDIHITNGYYRNITNLDYMDFEINALQEKYRKGQITLLDWLNQIPSEPTQNFFFKNEGQLKFSDVSDQWQAQTEFSNGAAYADLDNDGKLDLIVNNINGEAHILKNVMPGNEHHYLSLKLKDENNIIQTTKVKCYTSDNKVLTEIYNPQRGYLSSTQHRLHFGLGKAKVDSLEIYWPDGSFQTLKSPEINQILEVEKSAESNVFNHEQTYSTLFQASEVPFEQHQENSNYSEFDYERLIDRSYSDLGPDALVLDVDKDGLEDVIISGGKDQAAQVYKQTTQGRFSPVKIPEFENDKAFEDTTLATLDANQDGFADVLIGSGSNEHELTKTHYPLRLYLYRPSTQTFERADFPDVAVSTSKILVADFDKDGLEDVFVAARNQPKNFPNTPKSCVFKQTENGFINKTKDWISDARFGILTDAVYEDINNDDKPELVLVGEWMAPRVFQFEDGFKEVSENNSFQHLKGLWESIHIIDINGDGLKDILLGNRGLNNIYKASPEQPLKMLVGDLDENSTTDYLLFQPNTKGDYKPILGYKRVASQLPKIRKNFNRYEDYAKAGLEAYLKNPAYQIFEVNELKHLALLNKGDNQFSRIPLPYFTQNSIGRAIASLVISAQNHILLAGNHFDTDAEFTVYDASNGHVMVWNSEKNIFDLLPISKTGFMASGDVRNLKSLNINGRKAVLVLNNDNEPELFISK
jgi:hypothetical protein